MLDFSTDGRVMGGVLPTSELREAVRIAEGEGLAVMAHVNGAAQIKNALEAGVKSIEHGYWPDMSVIDYFIGTGAIWVPTRAAVHNLIGTGLFDDAVLHSILGAQQAVLQEAYRRGVLIASGSDCGASHVYQGSGTDDEYALLKKLGLDPEKGNQEIKRLFQRQ
jgi:imidazolonepropionase-like amidohydrolase